MGPAQLQGLRVLVGSPRFPPPPRSHQAHLHQAHLWSCRHSPMPFIIWVFSLSCGVGGVPPVTTSPAPPVLKHNLDSTAQLLLASSPDSAGQQLSLLGPLLQAGMALSSSGKPKMSRGRCKSKRNPAPLAPDLHPPHLGQLLPSDHHKPTTLCLLGLPEGPQGGERTSSTQGRAWVHPSLPAPQASRRPQHTNGAIRHCQGRVES